MRETNSKGCRTKTRPFLLAIRCLSIPVFKSHENQEEENAFHAKSGKKISSESAKIVVGTRVIVALPGKKCQQPLTPKAKAPETKWTGAELNRRHTDFQARTCRNFARKENS